MSTITTDLELALTHLQQGDIVAIPTETVYGLAGNAANEQAIRKIYTLKNRPLNHPLIMHVAENADLSRWVAHVPDYAQILIDNFWPGPLTLVFKSKAGQVSPSITGGQDTVAIRCPKHSLAQELLQKLDFPLVAPSANPFGKISPTTAEHVRYSFQHDDLLILDGGRCQVGIESTIVAATNPQSYEILRHGTIDENHIHSVLARQQFKDQTSIRVPGKLESHYQPEKPLFCFNDATTISNFIKQKNDLSVYVLSFSEIAQANPKLCYRLPNTPEQTAYELYFQLRCADQSQANCLVIELPPEQEQWQGVRERILKAGKLL
ncbi:t(6)A37 threonylcarbamoyladenosine biosynthesis protein RimN [Legionella massiliensis]|uniref:Threonylcarbamoyl-AMP synthase n=1 Tax=Legionella massiliensis TaxID=1034943 RepID=A0A078KQQ9_9GAMM|nr:L-threonylcarbamoyladenylate synthase [Legionella massiliensis]CDZ76745.1 t(6)A37 threonylcarbamoyladenosine biosynthesis protein RimN [Legionella massiliensis]CEE12483.1 Threonylcarbamoyl-AMP synthase [Legionella massiliensis]